MAHSSTPPPHTRARRHGAAVCGHGPLAACCGRARRPGPRCAASCTTGGWSPLVGREPHASAGGVLSWGASAGGGGAQRACPSGGVHLQRGMAPAAAPGPRVAPAPPRPAGGFWGARHALEPIHVQAGLGGCPGDAVEGCVCVCVVVVVVVMVCVGWVGWVGGVGGGHARWPCPPRCPRCAVLQQVLPPAHGQGLGRGLGRWQVATCPRPSKKAYSHMPAAAQLNLHSWHVEVVNTTAKAHAAATGGGCMHMCQAHLLPARPCPALTCAAARVPRHRSAPSPHARTPPSFFPLLQCGPRSTACMGCRAAQDRAPAALAAGA